jgi:ribosomal protein L44E
VNRFDVAVRLGIPLQMAQKHAIPARMTDAEFTELDENPPPWLAQSRANRTGKLVWVELKCSVCGYSEHARPKKWWPTFTYLTCDFHEIHEVPAPKDGLYREEFDGIGSRFVGIVDSSPNR